jgi:hypothetical protein
MGPATEKGNSCSSAATPRRPACTKRSERLTFGAGSRSWMAQHGSRVFVGNRAAPGRPSPYLA